MDKELENFLKTAKITITNDIMFRLVMEKEENCRPLIECALDIKIAKLTVISAQKSFQEALFERGTRLDFYAVDDKGNTYNIEMQKESDKKQFLGKRSRYYKSLMDIHALKQGEDYEKLPKTVVIFICTFDPFDRNLARYTFSSLCHEAPGLSLDDNTSTVFINTLGDTTGLNKSLVNLIDFFNEKEAADNYTKKLYNEVDIYNKDNQRREMFNMTLDDFIKMKLEQATAESFAEGYASAKIDSYKDLIKNGLTTIEQLLSANIITQEEVALLQTT